MLKRKLHLFGKNENYSPMLAYRDNTKRWSVTRARVCTDQTQVDTPRTMFERDEEQDENG